MTDFQIKYSRIWGNNPSSLLAQYNYQHDLTAKLDILDVDNFDRQTLYEIVLWKINRFPHIDDALISDLKAIKEIKPKEHELAGPLLDRLLCTPGIRLPMASTILRFLNPQAFQIIDDRAYRLALPGEKKYPAKPPTVTSGYLESSRKIYFHYLSELHKLSTKNLPFSSADRILYQLDIVLGNKIGDSAN